MRKLKDLIQERIDRDPCFTERYDFEREQFLRSEPDYPDDVEFSTLPLTDGSSSAELPF